jgi:kynurenine formamidase
VKEAWNRWGENDERGALNLIGAANVTRAAASVREGRVMSLAQELSSRTPVPEHRAPMRHFMERDGGDYAAGAKRPGGFQFAEDSVLMPLHVGTHIDALCHAWYEDHLYNGFSANDTRSKGAVRCGVEKLTPIFTRGILLDVAASRQRPMLAGEVITVDELRALAQNAGIAPESGDVVLIRTGWMEHHGDDGAAYFNGEPGLDEAAALWLAKSGVAVIGADNFAIEQIPFPNGKVFPVHQRLIRDYGIPLLENVVLKALAQAQTVEFLFIATPLPFVGGTGSPVCPIVVL